MSEWSKEKLGNLISIKGGYSYKGEHIGRGSALLLGMGCVSFTETFLQSGARPYDGDVPDSFIAKPGDIVLATRQQSDNLPILGAPAIIPENLKNRKIIVGTNLYRIENSSSVSNHFLFWLLKSVNYKNHIDSCSKGSTVKMITKDAIESFEFICPPEKERNYISEILWILTSKIDLLHRQNETLEKMAETLFRQWFVEEAKAEWEIMKLGTKISTNKYTVGRNYSFSQIEYLDTSSITNGVISGTQQLDILSAPSRAKRLVRHNDIIISTVRPDQRHFGIVKYPKDNLVVSTGFCVITCHEISPYFIYLSLTSREMTDYLHSIAEGSTSTYPSLRPADIENIELVVPPTEKLEEFDKIASSWFDKIYANNEKTKTLTSLRDSLLPKLMSGEVSVSNFEEVNFELKH